MSERDPTPDELRDADALARALEGEAAPGAPRDALEASDLVRAAGPFGTLSPERGRAVLARIESAASRRRGPRWARRLAIAAAAAGVAALALLPLQMRARDPSLPQPSAALLAAQAGAAQGAPLQAFEAQMRAYRASMYLRLALRYGGRR